MKTLKPLFLVVTLTLSGWLLPHPEAAAQQASKTPQTTKKHEVGTLGFNRAFTIGLGAQTGYFRGGGNASGSDSRLAYGLQLHIRLFRFLGLTAGYDFNPDQTAQPANVPLYPTLQLMGHLYLAQLGPMHLNLLGGVGFNFGPQNGGHALVAYIAGAELGCTLHPRAVLVGSFRFFFQSMEQASRYSQTPSQGTSNSLDASLLKRIFNPENFSISFAIRVFL